MAEKSLKQALGAQPDFSERFSKEIARLRDEVSQVVSARIEIDADMNYAASQRLRLFLKKDGAPAEPWSDDAELMITFFISSKGPYYTFRPSTKVAPRGYVVAPDLPLPGAAKGLVRAAQRVIEGAGYELLAGQVLNEEAKGCITDLDGKQATVFEALFRE